MAILSGDFSLAAFTGGFIYAVLLICHQEYADAEYQRADEPHREVFPLTEDHHGKQHGQHGARFIDRRHFVHVAYGQRFEIAYP